MEAFRFINVTKKHGTRTTLNNINLSASIGETVALIGPNGSGKTTIFKLLTGLEHPSLGIVQVFGKTSGKPENLKNIAYLPERSFLHKWMTIKEMINYYLNLYSDFDLNKMTDLLQFMELSPEMKISTLSSGMMKRFELALVLARQAPLVLLDEPFSVIDLFSREKIIDAIIQEHRFGEATLIITTHLLEEIEGLIERVVVIKDGIIVGDHNLEEWKITQQKSLNHLYREVIKS